MSFIKIVSKMIIVSMVWQNAAYASPEAAHALRARPFGERLSKTPKQPVTAALPVPDEALLNVWVSGAWQCTLKKGKHVNADAVRLALGTQSTASDVLAFGTVAMEFKGNISLVPDNNLYGRIFWFSDATGVPVIYLSAHAIQVLGPQERSRILREAQRLITYGRPHDINRLSLPRRVRRLAKASARAETRPARILANLYKVAQYHCDRGQNSEAIVTLKKIISADPDQQRAEAYLCTAAVGWFEAGKLDDAEKAFKLVAAADPDQAVAKKYLTEKIPAKRSSQTTSTSAADSGAGSSSGTPAAASGGPVVSPEAMWRRMVAASKAGFNRVMIPNMTGAIAKSQTVTVRIDTTDSARPGFSFVQFELPWLNRRYTPLLTDPRLIKGRPLQKGAARYQAVVSFGDLGRRLHEQYPDFFQQIVDEDTSRIELPKEVKVNLDQDVLKYPLERRIRWLAKMALLITPLLKLQDGSFEQARRQHPQEVGAILEFLRQRYDAHRRLNEKVQAAKHYLETHKNGNYVERDAICHVIDSLDEALEPWPQLQLHVRHLKAGLGPDAKRELSECLTLYGFSIPYEAHLRDILDLYAIAPSDILARTYYDACRVVWAEKMLQLAGRQSEDDVCEVYRTAQWALTLAWEEGFTMEAAGHAVNLGPDETVSIRHVGAIGVLFLDERGSPRRFVEGGGAVVSTEDLGGYFLPYRLAEWYRPGDKIVLVFPSLSGDVNYEQLSAYMGSWRILQRFLPGTPEVWLAAQPILTGEPAFFKPVNPRDPQCWERLAGRITDMHPAWQKFTEFLGKEVYLPPQVDFAAAEKAAQAKRSVRTNRLQTRRKASGPMQYKATAQIRTADDLIDAAREESKRLHTVASTLPEIFRKGLRDNFGDETARAIMDIVVEEDNFGGDFRDLASGAASQAPDVLYDEICGLAEDVQLHVAELLAFHILDDAGLFERVNVAGISGLQSPLETPLRRRATPAPAPAETQAGDAQTKIEADADRISKELIRQCGKHPDIFAIGQKELWEKFVRDQVVKQLRAGAKLPRYLDLQRAWSAERLKIEQAEQQKRQAEAAARLKVQQEADAVRLLAEQAAKKVQDQLVNDAQTVITEADELAELVTADDTVLVKATLERAAAALAKLVDPVADTGVRDSLDTAMVTLRDKFVAAERKKTHGQDVTQAETALSEIGTLTRKATYNDAAAIRSTLAIAAEALTKLDPAEDARLRDSLTEAAGVLTRKFEELEQDAQLSDEQRLAKKLLRGKQFATVRNEFDPDMPEIINFLTAVLEARPYKKAGKLAKKVRHTATAGQRAGDPGVFYREVAQMAESYIAPNPQAAQQAIDSSVLRPGAFYGRSYRAINE